MFTCGECGQEGACYCPDVDTNDNPQGDKFHPLCYAKRGIVTHEDFQCSRRYRSNGLPAPAKAALRPLRHQAGNYRQLKPQPMRRL